MALADSPLPAASGPNSPPPAAVPDLAAGFRILGQAGGAYIVLEDDAGVKLVDQHALHERVLFDGLLERARAGRAESQGLLLPEVLELTPAQAAAYDDPAARQALAAFGYDLAPFGPRTLAVRAVPTLLTGARAGAFARDVLDAFAQLADDHPAGRPPPGPEALREKAAYVLACKAAVKAGERLTQAQMHALVLEFRRRAPASGFTCPHGRPLAVELPWDELERRVGR